MDVFLILSLVQYPLKTNRIITHEYSKHWYK